jgi:hypothetical protein
MMLIRYAGYDPNEDDIEDLMPWHFPGRKYPTIDVERVRALRARGWPWWAIGEFLAIEAGRPVPFHRDSVYAAARRSR